eukprot:jgi/Mesvir1/23219/Mv22676-RA.2
MADMARLSLQERIKLHSDFFNRLVDCVPAKFYIPKEEPDDASGPFKRGKKSISAKLAAKKEGKKAKRARLDPLASVNTVEAVRLKKAKEAEAAALAKEREGDGGEGHEGGSNSDRGGAPGNAGEPAPKRAMSHEELKQRLHQRIEEMRARRHAEKAEDSKKRKAEEAKSWRKQAEGAARKKPRGEPDKPTTGGAGGQDQGTLAGVAGVNGIIPRPKGGLTSTQALKATVEATLRSEAGGGMVFPQMVATPGNVDELLEERWQQRQQKKKGGDKAHALQKVRARGVRKRARCNGWGPWRGGGPRDVRAQGQQAWVAPAVGEQAVRSQVASVVIIKLAIVIRMGSMPWMTSARMVTTMADRQDDPAHGTWVLPRGCNH